MTCINIYVTMLKEHIKEFCSGGSQKVSSVSQTPSTQTRLMRTLRSKVWLIQLGTDEANNAGTMKVAIS